MAVGPQAVEALDRLEVFQAQAHHPRPGLGLELSAPDDHAAHTVGGAYSEVTLQGVQGFGPDAENARRRGYRELLDDARDGFGISGGVEAQELGKLGLDNERLDPALTLGPQDAGRDRCRRIEVAERIGGPWPVARDEFDRLVAAGVAQGGIGLEEGHGLMLPTIGRRSAQLPFSARRRS